MQCKQNEDEEFKRFKGLDETSRCITTRRSTTAVSSTTRQKARKDDSITQIDHSDRHIPEVRPTDAGLQEGLTAHRGQQKKGDCMNEPEPEPHELYVPWTFQGQEMFFSTFGYKFTRHELDKLIGIPKGFVTVPVGNLRSNQMMFYSNASKLKKYNVDLLGAYTVGPRTYPFFIAFESLPELTIQPTPDQIRYARMYSSLDDLAKPESKLDEHAAMLRFFGSRAGTWNGFKKD